MSERLAGAWTLRPATPRDADGCAVLVLQPPAGLHGIVGDPNARLRIARSTFLAPGTAFGWERTLVAEADGRVVGMAARFPQSEWTRIRMRTGMAMLGAAGPRYGVALIRRGRLEERAMAPIPRGRAYVMSLAVIPAWRGRGIGASLLRAISDEAREGGLEAIALDVAEENERAVRFYLCEGFIGVAESRIPPTGKTPEITMLRMERMVEIGP